jgi:hypothetical protein
LFPSGFLIQTLYALLLFFIHPTCSAHLILCNCINRSVFGEVYKSVSSTLCSLFYSSVTSSILGPNIFLNILFFEHPQPTFLPQRVTPSLINIHSNKQNYNFLS